MIRLFAAIFDLVEDLEILHIRHNYNISKWVRIENVDEIQKPHICTFSMRTEILVYKAHYRNWLPLYGVCGYKRSPCMFRCDNVSVYWDYVPSDVT